MGSRSDTSERQMGSEDNPNYWICICYISGLFLFHRLFCSFLVLGF